jgi:hypothetical protein
MALRRGCKPPTPNGCQMQSVRPRCRPPTTNMHVETHNPGAVPQRNGATSPIRPLAILGRPLMVLLLLAPALAANPPAYHRRALVELDNLDLGNGHSRAQAASLFAEESGEPLPA